MSTMREALESAMGTEGAHGALAALNAAGVTVATQDTMTQAIHDVYCGVMADHEHPSEKDAEQARALLAALAKQ